MVPATCSLKRKKHCPGEAGAKLDLMDGRARLNFAVFRTEYDDLQVSVYDGVIGFDVQNAAEATTQGLEMDGSCRSPAALSSARLLAIPTSSMKTTPMVLAAKGQTPDFVEGGLISATGMGKNQPVLPKLGGTWGQTTIALLATLWSCLHPWI